MPSKLAEEYRVRVQLKGGPFQIDESAPSVIKTAEPKLTPKEE